MYCNQIFSLISPVNSVNTVKNIIVCDNYEVANQISRLTYGQNAYAIDTTLIPVAVGDTHIDGVFKRGETVITAVPTEAQKIATLEVANATMSDTIIGLMDVINM